MPRARHHLQQADPGEDPHTLQRYLTEDALNSRFPGFGGNLSILGFIPTVQDLPQPSIDLVLNSLRHAEAIGDPRHPTWQRPCRTIRVISLPAQFLRPAQAIRRRDLVVISANSSPRIRSILSYHRQLGATRGIGGLVLTCDEGESLAPELRAEIISAGLPTVLIRGDSAATEARLFGALREYQTAGVRCRQGARGRGAVQRLLRRVPVSGDLRHRVA